MRNLEHIGMDLLPVTAYGDAAGLPVETWTHQEIHTKFGWLDHLEQVNVNPFFAGEHTAGAWSDDTQLSIAVIEGLMNADGFDIEAQAESFMCAYKNSTFIERKGTLVPRGWGRSTVHSAERLLQGVHPSRSGENNGTGNGVIMKLAPLVLWQAAKGTVDSERHYQYDALTNMTHDSDIARWASRVHGDVLHSLIQKDDLMGYDPSDVAEDILHIARTHENELGIGSEGGDLLSYISLPNLKDKPLKILDYTDAKGFYVPQTLAMTYGVFVHNLSDFSNTVYTAVNLGGDTDSTASIVANMVNFYDKNEVILPDDSKLLYDIDQLRRISKAFINQALEGVK